MPLYEYACPTCRNDFELLIRQGDTPRCPTCGSERVEKLLSVPATPTGSASDFPICDSPAPTSGCGRPQCGGGFCAGM